MLNRNTATPLPICQELGSELSQLSKPNKLRKNFQIKEIPSRSPPLLEYLDRIFSEKIVSDVTRILLEHINFDTEWLQAAYTLKGHFKPS